MVQKLSTFLSTSLVANALDSAEVSKIVQAETILLDSGTSGNYIKSLTGTAFNISAAAHSLAANIDIDSNHIVHRTGIQTLLNKTINLTNNSLAGTLSQFSAAVSGDNLVGETATQTLTNKTLTSPSINTPTITGPGSVTKISTFGLRDQTTTGFDTRIVSNNATPALSANRTLTLDVNNADRTISLAGNINTSGNLTLGGALTTSGAHGTTLTTTGTTAVTLPTSGTLVSKDGNGDFSAGTITATFVGNLTGQISDISNLTTDSLAEGSTNLYYTTARVNSAFDTRFLTKDTDSLAEGTSNLYYTTTRANAAIDARVTKTFVDNLNVDADTLDGINSTSFLRSDADDTTTGALTIDTTGRALKITGTTTLDAADASIYLGNAPASYGFDITYEGTGSGNTNAFVITSTNAGTPKELIRANQDGIVKLVQSGATIAGNTIWHAGNDGAGSTLDADLLDGQQGSHYRIDVYDASGTLLN